MATARKTVVVTVVSAVKAVTFQETRAIDNDVSIQQGICMGEAGLLMLCRTRKEEREYKIN